MTSTRNNAIKDTYLYEIPVTMRQRLCIALSKQNVWKELARHMRYELSDIEEIEYAARQTNDSEAEELLSRWGELNHTVTELFILLLTMHQYQAMSLIKSEVDQRYHKLIPKTIKTHTENLNERERNKSTYKESGKILNAPPAYSMSNENNETGHRNGNKQTHDDALDVNEYASAIPKIDYKELRDATNNWSDNHVLGKGGFGTVFRGMWKCTSVAIKRIENRGASDTKINKIQMEQSLNELRHLNSCRHDNILPLYGYSINGDEPCLVYQLMLGGSLEQKLFKCPANVSPLKWNQRVNIAIGTARGLQYLHTFQNNKKPLIHGDIKPANILLDPYHQPKIGDFGLAREGSFDDEHMTVSRAYGTRPYLPAEFLEHHILSVKVDSYSFGVVLFELATSLRAFDKLRTPHKYLTNHIRSHTVHGTLLELIDQAPDRDHHTEKIFTIIIDLGNKCTQKRPEVRPGMVEVLQILENSLPYNQEHYCSS